MKKTLVRSAWLLMLAALLVASFGAALPTQSARADDSCDPNEACGPSTGAPSAVSAPALPIVDVISNLPASSDGGYGANTDFTLAAGFTTSANVYSLNTFTLKIFNLTGLNYTASAWLYSDSAGSPGSALATFTPITVTAAETSWDNIRVMSLTSPYILLPNTTYWIVLVTDKPGPGGVYWGYSTTTAPSGIFTYVDSLYNYLSGGWTSFSSEYIWSLQAELVTVASGSNLLLNPGFDSFGSAPRAWSYSVLNVPVSSLSDCTYYYYSPFCSLKLTSSRSTAIVTQTVSYNGLGGESFGYGLSSAALNVASGGSYRVEVALFNRFNRVMYTVFNTFSDGTHGWETRSGSFAAPAAFTKIRFRFYFQKAYGTAWFDEAFLSPVP